MNSQRQHRAIKVLLILLLLLPLCFVLAIAFGAVDLPVNEVLPVLLGLDSQQSQLATIVERIRLPRALLALLIGALLAISGAAMQGLFRNPLADPSLIGVTAGASVGAALTIVISGSVLVAAQDSWASLSLVSIGALFGGAIAVWLVYRLATSEQGTSVATMLLAGIASTAVAGCITSMLEYYANNEMLRRISLWRMGGLDGANMYRVLIAAAVAVIVIGFLCAQAQALNALLLGESEARHLGVDVDQLKQRLVLLVAAGVGVAVALAGAIGFIGLVVPHIMRMLIGPDHRYLLVASALGGAILLLLADTLARVVVAPTELPVGLVTALVGAPFFISLLRRRHDYGM